MSIKFMLSSTAPKPTWIYERECHNPAELVEAIHSQWGYCHYFDENGSDLDLNQALIHLGVTEKNLNHFKRNNGFFVLEIGDPPSSTKTWVTRLIRAGVILFVLLAITIVFLLSR